MRRMMLVLAALAFVAGCGGPSMAPVKGRITCNGKPVPQAALVFDPEPKTETDRLAGKPGTGFTDDDGNYVISTYKAFDGAQIGKHRVTVSLEDSNPARCPRKQHFAREVIAGDNVVDIDLAPKDGTTK